MVAVTTIGLAILLSHTCQSSARVPQSSNLVIEAIVTKIGKAPGVGSGFHAIYQFAKYKVTSVCKGEYEQREIVVDHLILYGNELDELKSGDRVRLVIEKSNKIFSRNDEEGFRDANDKVETFYIGEKPQRLLANCVPCESCS
jgi:hypothetical protein